MGVAKRIRTKRSAKESIIKAEDEPNPINAIKKNPEHFLAIDTRQTRAGRSKVNITPPQSLKRIYPGDDESNYWFAYESGEVYYPVILTDKSGKFINLPKDCGLELRMTIATTGHGPDAEPAEIQTISTKGIFWFKAIKAYIFGKIKLSFDIVGNSKNYLKEQEIPDPLEYEIDVSVDEHGNKAPDLAVLSSLNQGQYYDYVYDDASSDNTSSSAGADDNGLDLLLDDGYEDSKGCRMHSRRNRNANAKASKAKVNMLIKGSGEGGSIRVIGDRDSPTAVSDGSGDGLISNNNANSSSRYGAKDSDKQQKLTKYEGGTIYDVDQLWGPRRSYGSTRSRKHTTVAGDEDDDEDDDDDDDDDDVDENSLDGLNENNLDEKRLGSLLGKRGRPLAGSQKSAAATAQQYAQVGLKDVDHDDLFKAAISEFDIMVPEMTTKRTARIAALKVAKTNNLGETNVKAIHTNMTSDAPPEVFPRFRSYSRDPADPNHDSDADGSDGNVLGGAQRLSSAGDSEPFNHLLLQTDSAFAEGDETLTQSRGAGPRMKTTTSQKKVVEAVPLLVSVSASGGEDPAAAFSTEGSIQLQQLQQQLMPQKRPCAMPHQQNQFIYRNKREYDAMMVVDPLQSPDDAFARIWKVLDLRSSLNDVTTALDVNSMLDELLQATPGGHSHSHSSNSSSSSRGGRVNSHLNTHAHKALSIRTTQLRAMLEAKKNMDIALQSFLKHG